MGNENAVFQTPNALEIDSNTRFSQASRQANAQTQNITDSIAKVEMRQQHSIEFFDKYNQPVAIEKMRPTHDVEMECTDFSPGTILSSAITTVDTV
jgi:hypothetical protein